MPRDISNPDANPILILLLNLIGSFFLCGVPIGYFVLGQAEKALIAFGAVWGLVALGTVIGVLTLGIAYIFLLPCMWILMEQATEPGASLCGWPAPTA